MKVISAVSISLRLLMFHDPPFSFVFLYFHVIAAFHMGIYIWRNLAYPLLAMDFFGIR
jgi:hypothetical protein